MNKHSSVIKKRDTPNLPMRLLKGGAGAGMHICVVYKQKRFNNSFDLEFLDLQQVHMNGRFCNIDHLT